MILNLDTSFYVDVMHKMPLELGTYNYPFKDLSMPFLEIFNCYDAYPGANISVYVAATTSNYIPWSFKQNAIVIVDKNLTIDSYQHTS